MAFTGIMCTEAEIDQKSGANVNSAYTDTMKTQAVLQAESMCNVIGRYNFSDNWAATLNADVKYLLTMIVSSFVAKEAITYDPSGYTNQEEAANMINVLHDNVVNGLSLLREIDYVDFIKNA